MNSRGSKRRRAGLRLWLAFAMGLSFSTMLWIARHGEHSSSDAVWSEIPSSYVQERAVNRRLTEYRPPSIEGKANQSQKSQPQVRVYLSDSHRIETVSLEAYVKGVVAAEMPLDFEPAALEAQALAARTYIVRRLLLKDHTGMPVSAKNADVTDTQTHQVYRSLAELSRLQKSDAKGLRKVDDAVESTEGEVIVYRGEPIQALFFSASNGYTENSEEVFSAKLPYLRSVASPWDKWESPRSRESVEMGLAEFYRKLGADATAVKANPTHGASVRILEWTVGKRVKELLAGSVRLSGEEVRHRLGLRSASFNWSVEHNKIRITTYGSGHGVGMSQWGAQGMAKRGKTAREIVEYYYSGVTIEEASRLAVGSNGSNQG